MTIAALYVESGGSYFGLSGVEPYDEVRDARMYMGPHPVVAHPACQRWGKLWRGQPGNIKAGKVERLGDDKGGFKCALSDVRRWGGVLEHPEHSNAWKAFGLAKPPRAGGWVRADEQGGWTCRVEQGQYGHVVPKPTWLYAVRVDPLPDLKWGVFPVTDDMFPEEAMRKHGREYCRRAGLMAFHGGGKNSHKRIYTPPAFREILISMARSVEPRTVYG